MIEKNDEKTNVWMFSFGLERVDGKDIERKCARELIEYIVQWAEKRNLQIGGGFSLPEVNEDDDEPIFKLRDE